MPGSISVLLPSSFDRPGQRIKCQIKLSLKFEDHCLSTAKNLFLGLCSCCCSTSRCMHRRPHRRTWRKTPPAMPTPPVASVVMPSRPGTGKIPITTGRCVRRLQPICWAISSDARFKRWRCAGEVFPPRREVLRQHRRRGWQTGGLPYSLHLWLQTAAAVPGGVSRWPPAEPDHCLGYTTEGRRWTALVLALPWSAFCAE